MSFSVCLFLTLWPSCSAGRGEAAAASHRSRERRAAQRRRPRGGPARLASPRVTTAAPRARQPRAQAREEGAPVALRSSSGAAGAGGSCSLAAVPLSAGAGPVPLLSGWRPELGKCFKKTSLG